MHKADQLWNGSSIVLEQCLGPLDPLPIFKQYLKLCNAIFPHLPNLWLTQAGKIPTQSWFITKLCVLFPSDNVAGHSLCACHTPPQFNLMEPCHVHTHLTMDCDLTQSRHCHAGQCGTVSDPAISDISGHLWTGRDG